jgi:hypothetical protein
MLKTKTARIKMRAVFVFEQVSCQTAYVFQASLF